MYLWSETKTSKEFSSEEEWIGSLTRNSRAGRKHEERDFSLIYPGYIKDILGEKFDKASMQLDVGVMSKKDRNENMDKIDALLIVVANGLKGKKNYIRLCKRLTDGSTTSLMQKLRGKDYVKLSRSEFHLEPSTRIGKRVTWLSL